ncbi:MAG: hypothetical protein Q4G62_07355, partial [Pseudomonadota bacterium]|nr:hypothetical protein [Pseudomonadota bacterium]
MNLTPLARRLSWLPLTSALVIVSSFAAMAAVVPQQEYGNYVDRQRMVEQGGSAPFGEQINLRDGGLQFRVVDVDIPGTGPAIRLARTFRVNEAAKTAETSGNTLGDWELEVPRIKTITANALGTRGNSPFGWQVPGINKNARCSNFAAPGPISFWDAARHWEPGEWWSGYQLVDGLGRSQELLQVIGTYPEVAGYKAVTNQNWRVSCLPATANGEPGEGFLATDPDGNRYWFDYLVYTPADTLSKALWTLPVPSASGARTANDLPIQSRFSPAQDDLPRRFASLLVSRIEDRFGNSVVYQYSAGKLIRVVASDGREMSISHDNALPTVIVNTGASQRIWRYSIQGAQPSHYLRGTLTQVQLPDGSRWAYSFSQFSAASLLWESSMSLNMCEKQDSALARTIEGTVIAPSGAVGRFVLAGRGFGRSNVPRECWGGSGPIDSGYALIPAGWAAYALSSRTQTGPGLPPATWAYSYSPSHASWSSECNSGCVNEVWTDEMNPEGARTRSVFSNRFDDSENLLLREETFETNGNLLRRVSYGYADSTTGVAWPWPTVLGSDMQSRTNEARTSKWVPIRSRTFEQQGITLNYRVNDYDRFANPVSVRKWSSLGHDRTDLTEYYHDVGKWVLGRAKRAVNKTTDLVPSRIEFDPATILPIRIHAFEKLQQTLTYHPDGTVATIKDGLNQTTTFSNWHRGIPQNIAYADSTTQSAV